MNAPITNDATFSSPVAAIVDNLYRHQLLSPLRRNDQQYTGKRVRLPTLPIQLWNNDSAITTVVDSATAPPRAFPAVTTDPTLAAAHYAVTDRQC